MNSATGNPVPWPDPQKYAKKCSEVKKELGDRCSGLFTSMMNRMSGRSNALVHEWMQAYDAMVNAEINAMRRELMLGENGILNECFVKPAETLAKQVYTFGKILGELDMGYRKLCGTVDQYGALAGADTEGILAGLNPQCHDYMMRELHMRCDRVDMEALRSGLVENFFNAPDEWLRVEEREVRIRADGTLAALAPVNARRVFERYIASACEMGHMNFAVDELLEFCGCEPTEIANQIVRELRSRCKLLYDGKLTGDEWSVLLPAGLQRSPEVVSAIRNACYTILDAFPRVMFVGDTEAIRLVRTSNVRLDQNYDLGNWERSYRQALNRPCNGLHGLSQDQLAGGSSSWADQPDLLDG